MEEGKIDSVESTSDTSQVVANAPVAEKIENAGLKTQKNGSTITKFVLGFVVLALFFCCAVTNCVGGDGDDAAVKDTTPVAAVPNEDASSVPPETKAPAPAVKKTFVDFLNDNLGTFAPYEVSGVGDGVVDLNPAYPVVLVTATHSGSSNFSIHTLDASNNDLDLLVNEIGAYSGTTSTLGSGAEAVKLKIGADGNWTIKIAPVGSAARLASGASGTGDSVAILDEGKALNLTISHVGESNFAVWADGENTSDLLVNEIGNYSGVIPVGADSALLRITADGQWTISW